MIQRFGRFELDESRRELRLDGRELVLQPRIFDLLAYLIRHRDRMVPKDELLDRLWSGVVVADGALQRAVSLARSALREGKAQDAIRTFPRQGYRFCGEVLADAQPERSASPLGAAVERGREAYDACDWEGAVRAFEEADADHPLGASDLERWALAEACLGRGKEALGPLERASAAHAAAGDTRGMARAALLLVQLTFEHRQFTVARGWHRRAASLLESLDPSPEHGHLAWTQSRFALLEGDHPQAAERGEAAAEIGRSLGDADVEMLGLHYKGHALLAMGDVAGGQAAHDEAAAAVLGGTVSPWAGGIIYCGIIWACRNRGDWARASQWSEQFVRWCEQSGIHRYPGSCALHHAEVLSMQGELARAEKEIRQACDQLPMTAPWSEGDAWRVLGDLQLARGEMDEAARSFARAHALGWDPNPGHALLLAIRGEAPAAIRALERSLQEESWASRQRRELLRCHLVTLLAAWAGQADRAREVWEELGEGRADEPLHVRAWRARASGELALAEGRAGEAAGSFRAALELWREGGSPLQAARVRLRLAAALAAEGDTGARAMEEAAAREAFAALGLPPAPQPPA